MKLNPSYYPPKAISSAKQISSTKVDFFRRKTDLVEKKTSYWMSFFLAGLEGLEPPKCRNQNPVPYQLGDSPILSFKKRFKKKHF